MISWTMATSLVRSLFRFTREPESLLPIMVRYPIIGPILFLFSSSVVLEHGLMSKPQPLELSSARLGSFSFATDGREFALSNRTLGFLENSSNMLAGFDCAAASIFHRRFTMAVVFVRLE